MPRREPSTLRERIATLLADARDRGGVPPMARSLALAAGLRQLRRSTPRILPALQHACSPEPLRRDAAASG